MLIRVFLLAWLGTGGLLYVLFYTACNKGWIKSLPPELAAIVDEPVGIMALFFVFAIAGPLTLAGLSVSGSKGNGSSITVEVETKS